MKPALQVLESAMRLAIAEAKKAREEGDLPYGAVIVTADGQLVASCHDMVARTGDPTRHGEIDVVRLAIARRGSNLAGCVLVSTTEPCCMCSGAAWYAGIQTVAFGLDMTELKELRPDALEAPLGPIANVYRGMARQFFTVPGVLRAECIELWTGPLHDRFAKWR